MAARYLVDVTGGSAEHLNPARRGLVHGHDEVFHRQR